MFGCGVVCVVIDLFSWILGDVCDWFVCCDLCCVRFVCCFGVCCVFAYLAGICSVGILLIVLVGCFMV